MGPTLSGVIRLRDDAETERAGRFSTRRAGQR